MTLSFERLICLNTDNIDILITIFLLNSILLKLVSAYKF